MNKITAFSIVGALTLTVCLVQSSSALTGAETDMFSQNDITFWDPDECGARGNTKVAVCGVTLPSKTVQQLDNEKVKESVEKNIDRYKYAEEQTGVPWQAIAALHYREASMASDASISNGQKLTSDGSCYYNVDNIKICSDANKDAEQAAKHLLEMGKSVYGVDILSDGSQEAFGKAFLAYNRGYMYESAGAAWDTSPYVMNGFDEDHMNMKWQHADSWYKGEKLNSVEGGTDGRPGALAVFAYLCGNSSSSSSDQTSNTSGGVSGSNITWIGDSYSVGASDIISEKFSGVDFGSGTKNTSASYIQGSKFVGGTNANNPPCLTILENIIKSNSLRPYVVFACGTNGGWSESDISKFKDLLKNTTSKAIVVTSKIPSNSYTESNKRLQDLANANDDIFLADWTAVYEESYFSGDPEKIHPVSGDGYKKWVGVISDALSKAAGDSCTTYEGKYPQYYQGNFDASDHGPNTKDWTGLPYGQGTVASSGCGLVSMSMLSTIATGKDIYPQDILAISGIKDYSVDGLVTVNDPLVGKHFGFEVIPEIVSSVDEGKQKIKQYLKDGYMIHLVVKGTGGDSRIVTKGSVHYIGIADIDNNDEVTTLNSAFQGNVKVAFEDIFNGTKVAWATQGGHLEFTAIKGSRKNGCSGLCADDQTSHSGGFKTVKEAQETVIKPYKSLPGEDICKAGLGFSCDQYSTIKNCVSFSRYFIAKYTSIDNVSSLTGDGSELAANFYNSFHSKYPKLQKSNKPTVFSVGSYGGGSNHTFIVLGIDEANDKMIIGEAGWGSPKSFIDAKEKSLSSSSDGKYNGTAGVTTYVDFSAYLKGI